MSEIKQSITINEAAEQYSGPTVGMSTSLKRAGTNIVLALRNGFKDGANWQKEQYKELLSLAAMAASTLEDEGDTATANEIIKEIERLESIN